jgi:hypothetical protein
LERSLCGKFPAPQCESQSITGDGIDESSRVSGEQQAGDSRRPHIDR